MEPGAVTGRARSAEHTADALFGLTRGESGGEASPTACGLLPSAAEAVRRPGFPPSLIPQVAKGKSVKSPSPLQGSSEARPGQTADVPEAPQEGSRPDQAGHRQEREI